MPDLRYVAEDATARLKRVLTQLRPLARHVHGALGRDPHPVLLVHALARQIRLADRVERAVAIGPPAGAAEDRRRPAGAVHSESSATALALTALAAACARGERGGFVGEVGRILGLVDWVAWLEALRSGFFERSVLVVVVDDPSALCT